MPVYKTVLKILSKNIRVLLLGFGVTIFMLLIMSSNLSNNSQTLQPAKVAIITPHTNSLSRSLKQYLNQQQQVVYLKDTSQKGLDDALFFQEVDYILYLPATASAQLQAEQKVKFKTKVRPGTYSKEMVDQNINQYFNTLTIYHRNLAHASWPNILEKTQQTLQHQGKVRFDKSYQRHQQQQHTALDYNILAYGLFLVIFEAYSLVSLVFNRQAVKTRNLCSPLAPNKFTQQINLGLLGYISLITAAFLAIIISYTQSSFNQVTGWFIINTVLFILSTMALSSWLSSYIKNAEALSGVANVYGLGTCFLGGVFIPRNIMPAFVSKIACFTPTYWFVQNNNLIGKTVDFNINFFQHFAPTALIILAFTVAFWTLQVCGQRLSKSHN